ncbi:hypothetical protein C8F04DRAFT_1182921 [Mycena alexandri]|uniref:Uncharacterized protein n=1 Tax=Mycena alexandri TaxID=1745969 RepID=A0AAD6X2W4_9AGAR|nr:hypothetical protein C8F04DRAFT_1182921 [Mycena alexandri]
MSILLAQALQSESQTNMDDPLRLTIHRRVIATYALNANAIDPNCFTPRITTNFSMPDVSIYRDLLVLNSSKLYGTLVTGGGRHKKFDTATLMPLLYDDHSLKNLAECTLYFEFQCTLENLYAELQKSEAFVAVDIPLVDLAPNLTRTELFTVAIIHGFRIPAKLKLEQAKATVLQHVCVDCPRILSIFKSVRPVTRPTKYNTDAYIRKKKNCWRILQKPDF